MRPTFFGRALARVAARNGHDDHANVVCGVLSLLAPPAFEQPNELTSPIIVSGGPITHLWGGVESSNGEQHETSKAESRQGLQPNCPIANVGFEDLIV